MEKGSSFAKAFGGTFGVLFAVVLAIFVVIFLVFLLFCGGCTALISVPPAVDAAREAADEASQKQQPELETKSNDRDAGEQRTSEHEQSEVETRDPDNASASENADKQEEKNPEETASTIQVGREYDIVKSVDLRAGPSQDQPRKINHKATEALGETHYLSVDPSVTVRVTGIKGDWVELQVTEPSHLTATHQGWIPIEFIQRGPSSEKRNGWIRHRCLVYTAKSSDATTIGYLSPPAAVNVADDNSGWLRLITGPIRIKGTERFVTDPNFEEGLYIETENFTTVIPARWNR